MREDFPRRNEQAAQWIPKTELGQRVMKGEFKSLAEILEKGMVILEPEIVDYLVPDLKQEVIYTGGSPGKGGGIRRTATRRTARMHRSGRRYKLSAMVVVGDEKNLIGIGASTSSEHRLALEKALTQAKLNMIRVKKGCGSWECGCGGDHSIKFKAEAKVGSVRIVIMPAPKGLGLVGSDTEKKMLRLAGIKDIWIKAYGQTSTRNNLAMAIFKALKKINSTKGDI